VAPVLPGEAIVKPTRTILVVEDHRDVRHFVLATLRTYGYRTLEAHDGQSGLSTFTRHRSSIDLVLTDIAMPVASGVDMAERILELWPAARIIFMSGTAHLAELPARLHGLPVLHKPFSAESLIGCIRQSLDDCLDSGTRSAEEQTSPGD